MCAAPTGPERRTRQELIPFRLSNFREPHFLNAICVVFLVLFHERPQGIQVCCIHGNLNIRRNGEIQPMFDAMCSVHKLALDSGIHCLNRTPVEGNYHAQTDIVPYAVNVPVACGGGG